MKMGGRLLTFQLRKKTLARDHTAIIARKMHTSIVAIRWVPRYLKAVQKQHETFWRYTIGARKSFHDDEVIIEVKALFGSDSANFYDEVLKNLSPDARRL